MEYDFGGWATVPNIRCSDGRTIDPDAFKHMDGAIRPLVWMHQHNDPNNVLGKALLKHSDRGMYAFCTFNDTESGRTAKELVQHGDVGSLSIHANKLRQVRGHVQHGEIIEVSLVLAGANPGAFIDDVIKHGDGADEEAIIYTGEKLELYHADESKEETDMADDANKSEGGKSIKDVFATMTEEQQKAAYAAIGMALEATADDDDDDDDNEAKHSEGGNIMRHLFDKSDFGDDATVLTHADQQGIIAMAKLPGVGTLQHAMAAFAEENQLKHGIDDIELLFPDYKLTNPGAPELLERDQSWVGHVMRGTHKSPISRIRTRQADARIDELRAHGYAKKGDEKKVSGNIKLLSRTTDPQTIYRKDSMHRDDIIDITDFDVVSYQWGIMRRNLEEEIARAVLIGDGRAEGDEMKIDETHVRSIWHDDDLYTIKAQVDIEAARKELQGTSTGAHFGENYIYAEAIITAALYSREKYKGSGSLEFYCTPHLLNVMLLARDLNGRRIYSSKADLAAALNVVAIHTVEQFEGQTREVSEGKVNKLLGIFVNLNDYQIGSTKGGEITKFDQFDIDFNQYKYLIETRISGALTKVYSAIVLEEPIAG